ncbi:MAG: sugar phosphate isomerase/epimerase family protein [Limisphaerales bacterium]|nr:xylose isomerase [Pedosphaera sp.]HAQ98609.1 xylose isomerase [Verrucomicrobiales bacterium]HAW02840.1 xylose isomerase [Verrucomicrobiales bacterium]HBP54500.1 xylose isomerase [Verrucomicrobiales bacterium]HCP37540.1 xylose isomerase [Verrucomicrobiales bacterium]|tara:strand:+ start:888 stop:1829 length:942 start_codon:yes stop_codon:yes gene_type:complete
MTPKVFIDRRKFLSLSAVSIAGTMMTGVSGLNVASLKADHHNDKGNRIYKSIKMGMFNEKISVHEKFKLMKEMGFDGAELNSPGGVDKEEALNASRELGFPIHGVVDSIHWGIRLSDPDPAIREKGLQGLLTAMKDTHFVGGDAVLLVPGAARDPENESHGHVWTRSIEQIKKALPTASKLGVRILIENVWNNFLYDPKGDNDQSASLLAAYLDEINSPWVGSYFDIGNHQRFGKPAEWIRTLGHRIVKLDVKDWGVDNGFCKIGDGDVDWADVRSALRQIGYTGWATAEVSGGDRHRIKDISERMDQYLLGK